MSDDMGDCMSPHVPVRQTNYRKLAWFPYSGGERVRVLAWTCECGSVIYELCESGGRAFVRRTVQDEKSPEISETHRVQVDESRAVWAAILTGMAK